MNMKTVWMSSIPLIAVLCVVALGFTLVYVMNAEALDCNYLADKCNDYTKRAGEVCEEYGSGSDECIDAQREAGGACGDYYQQCP